MKRLVLTAACAAAFATAGIADPSKSTMSAKDIKRQTVISTQSFDGAASSSGAMATLWIFTIVIALAALSTGGGSNHVHHPY